MRNTYNILRVCFWLPIVFAVAMAFVGEAGIADMTAGGDDADVREYRTLTVMELVTVVLLVAGAALMKTGFVRRDVKRRGYAALARWSLLRIAVIGVPLMINIVYYYIYVNVSFAYLTIIGAIFMAFAKPVEPKDEEQASE